MSRLKAVILAAACLATAPAAQAQTWPSQPIRVIVSFSAGTSDTIARLVGTESSRALFAAWKAAR